MAMVCDLLGGHFITAAAETLQARCYLTGDGNERKIRTFDVATQLSLSANFFPS